MAPLKSFLLVSSGIASALTCSNDNCEAGDQTALLQSHLTRKSELALSSTGAAFFPKLGNLNDPSTRKSALLEIQKTAVKLASMDASEATPVVIEVCTDTANMLNETVLHAIIEEHELDKAELASAFAGFDHSHYLDDANEALVAGAALVAAKELDLRSCRAEEEEICVEDDECPDPVGPTCASHPEQPCCHCPDCHNCEITGSLCQIDREIQQRWCEESTETERMVDTADGVSWRTETKNLFARYQDAVEGCTTACEECETIMVSCESIEHRYMTKAHECNLKYTEWETAKCSNVAGVSGFVSGYLQAYTATLLAYNDVVARVMIEEADRKVEWEVLTRVICLLLSLTNTEDGAAASDGNQLLIQRCWDEDVDTRHLDIDYLTPPSMGDIPVVEEPCSGPFLDSEYGIDIVDIEGLKPSSACYAVIIAHDTAHASGNGRSGCTCLATIPSMPTFELGHFLLIDPSVEVIGTQLSDTQWTAQIFGANSETATSMVGSMSPPHVGALPDVTSDFFSQEEIDAGSVIASVSWAYGSSQSFPEGALTLEERFAQSGGLLYMNEAGAVIAVRGFASTQTDLSQAATAFWSFEPSKEITAAQFTDTCGTGQDVTNDQHRFLGAEKYCWTQGALTGDGWSCTTGCFVYQTNTGHVAFPHSAA